MKSKRLYSLMPLLAMALSIPTLAEAPAIPATPAAVDDIIYAQPFTLQQPYRSNWQAEKPEVRSGMILVLRVNPDLVFPRQTAEPVLYAGDHTAERMNVGFESGYVIAIIPGTVDLEKVPIWFGAPDLPERVTIQEISDQRATAEAANIKPFSAEKVRAARLAGGETFMGADLDALHRHAARLILEYAPDERERAEGFMAPRVSR